jgi:hypothetical protein
VTAPALEDAEGGWDGFVADFEAQGGATRLAARASGQFCHLASVSCGRARLTADWPHQRQDAAGQRTDLQFAGPGPTRQARPAQPPGPRQARTEPHRHAARPPGPGRPGGTGAPQ